MADTTMHRTYNEREALQAVCAALCFSQLGVGRAARDQDGQELHLDMGLTCYVGDGAHDLLAKAQELVDQHGMAVGMYADLPLTTHDLRRAIPEDGRELIENHEATD